MTPDRGNTLPKKERLHGTRGISELMAHGRWGSCGCFKYCCLVGNGEDHDRLMISVPKKHFKRAVKRNLLKRRIRESYRTQKALLHCNAGPADLMLVYNTGEILDSEQIRTTVATILNTVSEWK